MMPVSEWSDALLCRASLSASEFDAARFTVRAMTRRSCRRRSLLIAGPARFHMANFTDSPLSEAALRHSAFAAAGASTG